MAQPSSLPLLALLNANIKLITGQQSAPAALQALAGLNSLWGCAHSNTGQQRRSIGSHRAAASHQHDPSVQQAPGIGTPCFSCACPSHLQAEAQTEATFSSSRLQPNHQGLLQQQMPFHRTGALQRHVHRARLQQAVLPYSIIRPQQYATACSILSRTSSRLQELYMPRSHQQQRRGFVSSTATAAVAMQASLIEELQKAVQADESQSLLTPAAVVERLDKVIVGQQDAKKAVAIAFRNRWRRQRVIDPDMRGEITPKNLLLMGPTGCGKTEIARRLAKLAEAPFIKVEATKFTEVGYHGRDVDSIIRDLVEVAQTTVKQRCKRAAAKRIAEAIESHIIHSILGEGVSHEALAEAREQYRAGELEDARIEIEIPISKSPGNDNNFTIQSGSMSVNVVQMFGGGFSPKTKERRTMTVAEARPYLEEMETERQFPPELIMKEAIRVAEQEGIVFIDEIDKIVNPSGMLRHGSDPSAEGVQRDLLPLIEGSVVSTKHGPVTTDHMLFIASGAFTSAKPSDMMAELQGRLPIRVELKGLTAADFEKILTEPECNMIYQQQQLLGCEGVELVFTNEAIREIAAMAEQINKEVENIGARRLHTVLERLVEDISFEAPDKVAEAGSEPLTATDSDSSSTKQAAVRTYVHVIDKKDVQEKLAELLKKQDLDKYIL